MMVSGDVVNDDEMGDKDQTNYFRDCFNPKNLKFSLWNERAADGDNNKFNNDFITLERDATTCYMKYKFKKQLAEDTMTCQEGDFTTVLQSEPSICTIPM